MSDHVLALQDECRDHVGSDAMKLRAELQQALQRESHVVTSTGRHIEADCDQRVQQFVQNEARLEDNLTSEALEEMTVMRQKLHEQELAMQKMHQDAEFEFSAATLRYSTKHTSLRLSWRMLSSARTSNWRLFNPSSRK